MSPRFASVASGECAIVARIMTMPGLGSAANDSDDGAGREEVLHDALRHFAAHGLGAAERAHRNATSAFFAGDSAGYRRWMAICRMLDRRLAQAPARRHGQDRG